MSTPTKILVVKIPMEGHNGDRATKLTKYLDYEVHALPPGAAVSDKTLLLEVDGYDTFMCHIRSAKQVENEALQFARKLAESFGCEVDIVDQSDLPNADDVWLQEWCERYASAKKLSDEAVDALKAFIVGRVAKAYAKGRSDVESEGPRD